MAITLISASAEPVSGLWTQYRGIFASDATALVSTMVVSGGAVGARTVTVGSITGFINGGLLSIAGGGNTGGTLPLETFITVTPASGVLTFNDRVVQTAGLTAAAAVTQAQKFTLPIRPRRVRLHNITPGDGETWEWIDGMPRGRIIKTVWATGVTTYETSGGLVGVSDGIWMPQAILGVTKTFSFQVDA